MLICLDLGFHMPMCLDLCSLHALCHLPCACMLHAMLVCLGLDLFVMPCAIAVLLFLLSHFLVFWHLVRARSRPYGLCRHPYTLVHIKGFGSPIFHVCACLLLCFMLMLASLVLGFATFDAFSGFVVVWLDSTPLRPYLDVAIWDASPWCRLLRAHLSPFPLRVTIAYHVFLCHPLALCASLHACLHVHAWVLIVSVSSMLQHNDAMDIRSKPTFAPRGHHLLFAILLVYPLLVVFYLACLPLCLYVCSHPICYFHCYLSFLFCALLLLSMCLSLSIARLLVSCLYLCMYRYGVRTHGVRAWFPRHKQKGCRCKLANMSRVAVFSRFRV